MNSYHPVSEEFLYCDPECVHDWISPCQAAEPCYACSLVEHTRVIARRVTPAPRAVHRVEYRVEDGEVPDEQ